MFFSDENQRHTGRVCGVDIMGARNPTQEQSHHPLIKNYNTEALGDMDTVQYLLATTISSNIKVELALTNKNLMYIVRPAGPIRPLLFTKLRFA